MPYDKPAAGLAPEKIALYCACFLLLASLGTAADRVAFLRRAVPVDATIVGYDQDSRGEGYSRSTVLGLGFRAIFVYRTLDGRRVQATSPRSAADHVPLRPLGSTIGVVYDPADLHAVPDTWPALWTPTIMLAGLGASMLAARFAFLAMRRRA